MVVVVVGFVFVVVGFVVAVIAVVLVVLVVVVVAVARWGCCCCCCRALRRGILLLKGSFGLLLVSLAGLGFSWALLWGPLWVLGALLGGPWCSLGALVGSLGAPRKALGVDGGPMETTLGKQAALQNHWLYYNIGDGSDRKSVTDINEYR